MYYQSSRHEVWRFRVPATAKNTFFHFFEKISFILLVLSSKYPHLRLDKFTGTQINKFLEHREFVTPSADQWTFLLVPKCDIPSRLCFFSQISRHVPAFQICEANFSKAIPNKDTKFSLQIAQDPRLQFRRKRFWKKIGFMGFFQKNFWKNAFFDCFSSLIPYISELRANTVSMVSQIVQAFYRLHFRIKITSKIFSYLVFLGKKEDWKFFEKFFLIRSSYFSKLIKDRETVLFREEQLRLRLFFGPTKLPSSSMTPSFFCQKNSIYFKKNSWFFFTWARISHDRDQNGVHGFVWLLRFM